MELVGTAGFSSD